MVVADNSLDALEEMRVQRVKALTTGCWNIRTLLNTGVTTERPEKRYTPVLTELVCYIVGIATLSETCLADEGELMEHAAGYSLLERRFRIRKDSRELALRIRHE